MPVTLEFYFKHLYRKNTISQLKHILMKANRVFFAAQLDKLSR